MTTTASLVRAAIERPWLTAAVVAGGALGITALVVVSGIVPIKASSGHWTLTHALLDFAKTRSVATASWGVRVPASLDEAGWILRGAAHYDTTCVMCHGAPDRPVPPVARAMTPAPPALNRRQLGRWRPEELFVIVKHGIKFTGMPAWPAQQRDDEVWAMVAFLRRLPSLDGAAYRRLARGEEGGLESRGSAGAPRLARDQCARCHGLDGTGRIDDAFPSLAGQRSAYAFGALRAYRDGGRFSGTMREVASRLSLEEMREIAAYYERLPARMRAAAPDGAAVERGGRLAAAGSPERDIPACIECHGPTPSPKSPEYPRLESQPAGYLRLQLRLLRERRRGGSPNVDLMHAFVNRLTKADIEDVSAFYAALPIGEAR